MMFPRMILLIGEPVLSFRKKTANDAKARALASARMFPQNPDVVSRSRKKRAIPPSATAMTHQSIGSGRSPRYQRAVIAKEIGAGYCKKKAVAAVVIRVAKTKSATVAA